MSFHLAAWAQSIDLATVFQPITAVQDPVITTQGNDVRVPAGLPNLVAATALVGNTAPLRAELQSPSLRAIANLDIEPIVAALVFGSYPDMIVHPDSPTPLVPNESLNFYLQATGGVATENYGLAWLSDGPLQAVKGSIFSVRATSGITLAANAWVNGNLAFAQTLPTGTYQVVGMRARGTNLVAARLAFVGGMWRPGVPAVNTVGQVDEVSFRYGYAGVFGQFDSTTPPTVDCLGVTDTAQSYILDLIRVK